jgi:hypothetical protein
MPDTSPRLDLPYLLPSQAQKHVTHNEALARLDLLVQMTVQALDAETPPAAPEPGQAFGLGPAPVAAWAGQGGRLAVWDGVAWAFATPAEGWCAFDLTAGRPMVFAGGSWGPVAPDPQNLDGVGIGTTSDPVNRLAVAADATLLSHDGTDHRLKINKAAAGNTASLLFQSGWTGHAEMGLAGDTAFTIKVSADGSTWTEAMRADPGAQTVSWAPAGSVRMALADTGLQLDVPMTGASVQSAPTDTTAGRLMRADYGYSRGNLLGVVAQSGGMPTGAVIERGSNANGTYARFADGTQICWKGGLNASYINASFCAANWTFPAAFIVAPMGGGVFVDGNIWSTAPPASGIARGDVHPVRGNNTTVAWSVQVFARSGISFGASDVVPMCATAIGFWY